MSRSATKRGKFVLVKQKRYISPGRRLASNAMHLRTLRKCRRTLVSLQERLEEHYFSLKEKYQPTLEKCQQITDLSFLGAYLTSTTLDAVFTLQNISHHEEESHSFTSFMMESYGVDEGLLRTQGMEALQLAALIGFSYLIRESWKVLKGKDIDVEVRLGLVYLYMSIGIGKHIQGILSWL